MEPVINYTEALEKRIEELTKERDALQARIGELREWIETISTTTYLSVDKYDGEHHRNLALEALAADEERGR